jgi:hypothetical protein
MVISGISGIKNGADEGFFLQLSLELIGKAHQDINGCRLSTPFPQ